MKEPSTEREFWIEMYIKYTKAYNYMQVNFECPYEIILETPPSITEKGCEYPIKHPLKRDLFDFFDNLGTYIIIERSARYSSTPWFFKLIRKKWMNGRFQSGGKTFDSRSEIETAAFNESFAILEQMLKLKQIPKTNET
jgi:hypothetical protein